MKSHGNASTHHYSWLNGEKTCRWKELLSAHQGPGAARVARLGARSRRVPGRQSWARSAVPVDGTPECGTPALGALQPAWGSLGASPAAPCCWVGVRVLGERTRRANASAGQKYPPRAYGGEDATYARFVDPTCFKSGGADLSWSTFALRLVGTGLTLSLQPFYGLRKAQEASSGSSELTRGQPKSNPSAWKLRVK